MKNIVWALGLLLVACGGGGRDGGGDDGDVDGDVDGGDVAVDEVVDEEVVEPVTVSGEMWVEGGGAVRVRIGPGRELEMVGSVDPMAELGVEALEAVETSPEWVREDLAWTLWRVGEEARAALSAEVLAAGEMVVDEVAWSIAVTPAAILEWVVENGYVSVFGVNAEGVYAVDVDYARLVELGDRTTLEWDGETGTGVLEPEQYYWWVVYPRAYMELPMFWGGDWWRSLFRLDTGVAPGIVGEVADAATVQEAAERVGYWVHDIMTFVYGTNELQPVEIYEAGHGSCGQYSILTTAAARTVLLPAASVSARADDHEWNEVWDGRWVMWDNSLGELGDNPHYPYVDMPEIFDRDTGGSEVLGEVAHVLRFRGDGWVEPCEGYTGYSDVGITVEDAAGDPVEGARVIARTSESGWWPCAWDYTDAAGVASFRLGDDLFYGFTSWHGVLGDWPAVGTEPGVSTVDAAVEETVTWGSVMPRTVTDMGDPSGDVSVNVQWSVVSTTEQRVNVITEGYELGDTYPVEREGGVVDVFLVDEAGLAAWEAGEETFPGWAVTLGGVEGEMEVSVPAGETWWLVIDNRWWPSSERVVSLSVGL